MKRHETIAGVEVCALHCVFSDPANAIQATIIIEDGNYSLVSKPPENVSHSGLIKETHTYHSNHSPDA